MPSFSVDVIESRAHLMQQVNDLTRNGYRWWCTGTVPLAKAQAWASKAETLYHISSDKNARTRAKKAGLGSAYLLMYRLDRSLSNNRLGWILLVSDGIHAAHKGEKLHRAEDDPVELFGYWLVREPRKGRKDPVWTWRLKRDAYNAWRNRIIDVVRRGSDYDIRRMLKDLSSVPGFSAIRLQQKALHRLVNAEWARRHQKGAKRGYTLPRIWQAHRMRVVRVDLATYLAALYEARRAAAAEAAENIAAAPLAEPESVFPIVVPADALEEAPDDDVDDTEGDDQSDQPEPAPSAPEREVSRVEKRWNVRYHVAPPARKKPRRDLRRDHAQPVRQSPLALPPPWEDSSEPPGVDSSSTPDASVEE